MILVTITPVKMSLKPLSEKTLVLMGQGEDRAMCHSKGDKPFGDPCSTDRHNLGRIRGGSGSSDQKDKVEHRPLISLVSQVEKATTDRAGPNTLPIDLEEEGEKDEKDEEDKEEEEVILPVAINSKPAKKDRATMKKGRHPTNWVMCPVNVTMDGKVNRIPYILTLGDLSNMADRYELVNIAWHLPEENEVACSDMTHKVYLFEHMFAWGMRLEDEAEKRPPDFNFLVEFLNSYVLSLGQLIANGFIIILGF